MDVLLVNCPIRVHAEPNVIPYGLATIASTLEGAGHHVEILDLNAQRMSEEEIASELSGRSWDLAGVSGLITTYSFQRWLIPLLRDLRPHAPVVSGGGLATCVPELVLSRTPVDMVALGEGEQTSLELAETLERGGDPAEVAGLMVRRRSGEVVRTEPRALVADLDSLPLPAWHLLPMETYLANPIWGAGTGNLSGFLGERLPKRSMNIIASRGCPFSCNYCYHLFGRSRYRIRSAENIADEVHALVERYHVDFVGFVDDNFMADAKVVTGFCDSLWRRGIRVRWGCHGRVTSAEPDLLRRMADAGCVWIGYGIESASPEILRRMNKRADPDRAAQAIIETRRAGIYANTTFMMGYPGETRETVEETVEFCKRLGIVQRFFLTTPYPGTPLYEQVRHLIPDEEKYIECLGDAYDFALNLTDLPDQQLLELKSWAEGELERAAAEVPPRGKEVAAC